MKTSAALTLLSVALVGCAGTSGPAATTVTATVVPPTVTVTVQASESSDPTASPSVTESATAAVAPKTYGPQGAFAVGRAQGGLDNVIPPGRYKATGDRGVLYHCDSVICQQGMDNPKSRDRIDGVSPVIVEIPPTDVAIYLWDVTLVGPVS